MKTYYKGHLYSNIIPRIIGLGRNEYEFSFDSETVNDAKVTKEDIEEFRNFFENNKEIIIDNDIKMYTEITSKKLINILKRILYSSKEKIKFSNISETIIYEKIQDTEGNQYGKEVLTGKIFPIYDSKNETSRYYLKESKTSYNIYLIIDKGYNVSTMEKCDCVIDREKIADNLDIIKYHQKYNQGTRKKQRFIEKIIKLSNKNVFKNKINTKENEELTTYKQPIITTTTISNIELLLEKLSKKNKELYNQYRSIYEKIISNENSNLAQLISLEGKIEFHLLCKKEDIDNISDYLTYLKNEYFEHNLNNNNLNTSITLEDIDAIEEIFLKTKNEYSEELQSKMSRDISLIYLMEIYKNIDNISIERLRESYFSNKLKSIIITIASLKHLEIIQTDLVFDLNEDITLENILNIIRNIKFNDNEKESIHRLIKTI